MQRCVPDDERALIRTCSRAPEGSDCAVHIDRDSTSGNTELSYRIPNARRGSAVDHSYADCIRLDIYADGVDAIERRDHVPASIRSRSSKMSCEVPPLTAASTSRFAASRSASEITGGGSTLISGSAGFATGCVHETTKPSRVRKGRNENLLWTFGCISHYDPRSSPVNHSILPEGFPAITFVHQNIKG